MGSMQVRDVVRAEIAKLFCTNLILSFPGVQKMYHNCTRENVYEMKQGFLKMYLSLNFSCVHENALLLTPLMVI
jgi:hypothetical protein